MTVDINNIRQGLEGKKGDADGQMNVLCRHCRQLQQLKDVVQVFNGKICIFEKGKKADIGCQCDDKRTFSAFSTLLGAADQQPENIVADNGEKHHQEIDSLPPGVKEKAGAQQDDISPS